MKINKLATRYFLLEIVLYSSFLLSVAFLSKGLFAINKPISDATSCSIYIPLFIFIIVAISMSFYMEYKYNGLKIKNIFLYLGIAISLCNFIAICCLPSVVNLPNGQTMTISGSLRAYSILFGFIIGLMPYLFFYAIPRKFYHKKYIQFVVVLFILIVGLFCLLSAILDFNNILTTIKSKFTDMSHPALSIFPHKNIFARMLFIGICASIIMEILTSKKRWLLLLIPFLGFELFTFAKMPVFISILAIASYFSYKLILSAKKSKDNLIISVSILGLCLFLITSFSLLISFSSSGFLFSIKKLFISIGEGAKNTFTSRLVIWDCTIKILKPFQYIIGFGLVPIGTAINIVYSHDERCHESTSQIWSAHNGGLEILSSGGIVYLLINIFFIVAIIYMCIKTYRKNKNLSVFTLIVLTVSIVHSFSDPIMFFNEGDMLFLSGLIIWPVASRYYSTIDKNEVVNLQHIVNCSNKISYNKDTKFFERVSLIKLKRDGKLIKENSR